MTHIYKQQFPVVFKDSLHIFCNLLSDDFWILMPLAIRFRAHILVDFFSFRHFEWSHLHEREVQVMWNFYSWSTICNNTKIYIYDSIQLHMLKWSYISRTSLYLKHIIHIPIFFTSTSGIVKSPQTQCTNCVKNTHTKIPVEITTNRELMR